jgi:predicted transcriptional regulator
MTKALKDVLARAESWPKDAQAELAAIALEIEAELAGDKYHASPEELAGIDRGLRAAREGRFATDAEIDAVLAKHRHA